MVAGDQPPPAVATSTTFSLLKSEGDTAVSAAAVRKIKVAARMVKTRAVFRTGPQYLDCSAISKSGGVESRFVFGGAANASENEPAMLDVPLDVHCAVSSAATASLSRLACSSKSLFGIGGSVNIREVIVG